MIGGDFMQFYISNKNFDNVDENILTLNCGENILIVSNTNRRLPFQEITPTNAKKILLHAEKLNLISHHEAWIQNNLHGLENFSLDYFSGDNFKIKDFLLDTENFSSESCIQNFDGYYKIFAKDYSDALSIAKNFCIELYLNNRLVSKCVNYIFAANENCTDDFNIENIFRQSAGGTVILESTGINFFHERIKNFSDKVLFIVIEIDKIILQKNNAFEILKNMPGLHEVKNILEQIKDNFQIQRLRENFGLEILKNNFHMVFVGNPGTANTTVARLLSQILGNGKFIECSRADLVEKYVGWTAKKIEKIFQEVRGGILFIDEAYSLIDENFGNEAINEIVRQMELFRDETIVIFAGYPDKMKIFLDSCK